MIITRVVVRNFRSLREVTVDCRELIAVLGRNGSGKSSFLKALAAFYDVSFQATPFDYFSKDTTLEISVTVTYGDLSPEELAEFQPYLSDKQLTVIKVINSGGAKYYGIAGQLEEFFEYRKLGAVPKRTSLNALIESKKYEGLGPKVKSEAEANALMEKFESDHPELLMTCPPI